MLDETEFAELMAKITGWLVVLLVGFVFLSIGLGIRIYNLTKTVRAEDGTEIITCKLSKQPKATIKFVTPDGTAYNVCQDCFLPMLQETQDDRDTKGIH
jgi:hypothetical protein